jgi:hypothetical protein
MAINIYNINVLCQINNFNAFVIVLYLCFSNIGQLLMDWNWNWNSAYFLHCNIKITVKYILISHH